MCRWWRNALRRSLFYTICVLVFVASHGVAQLPAPAPRDGGMVQITLQGEVPLKAVIDFLSQRLNLQFIYGQDIGNRRVTVRAPNQVPVRSLLPVFSSVLKMENLALVESQTAGWYRIVDVADMARFARTSDPVTVIRELGVATPVTVAIPLKSLQAQQMTTVLRPLLSPKGATIVAVPASNRVVISDYASNIQTIKAFVELVDVPTGDVVYEFYSAQNAKSGALVEQLKDVITNQSAVGTPSAPAKASSDGLRMFDAADFNQVIVVGPSSRVQRAIGLLKKLDTDTGVVTRFYKLKHVQPDRIDALIRGLLDPKDIGRGFTSTPDSDGNLLIVRATTDIHRRIVDFLRTLDTPTKSSESPIQFYKLKNANATDVLFTLQSLQQVYGGQSGGFGNQYGGFGAAGSIGQYNGINPLLLNQNGMNQGLNSQFQQTRLPLTPGSPGNGNNRTGFTNTGNPGNQNGRQNLNGNTQGVNLLFAGLGNSGLGAAAGLGTAELPGGARVSADAGTNSIVVYAPADVQPMYANLIKSLDQRRPQVLIEAKIVAVDTSDNFRLGVEVSAGDRTGDRRLFNFTSFGLSEVDRDSGALRIIPSLGFNGTMIDADVADVVVQALSRHSRARVLAAPKILVNDNSTGNLESVTSVPFQSVNASQTVSTTSLGGDQQAGTTIAVTPHINQDNHLLLEFNVEFSTFNGAGADGLPPPRQIDRVGSTVTIPDGQTVIVGGLKRGSETSSVAGLPFIEKIPLLRDLTQLQTSASQTTSFFLFIRPLILRDDRFEDLKYFSNKSATKAGVQGAFPRSRPTLMR